MTKEFIHLHVRSEFSVADGIVRIKELLAKAKELNMPAIAITDRCNLFAMVKFYQAANAAGIKPIFGTMVYIENEDDPKNPYFLLLYCQNKRGFANLTTLISKAHVDNKVYGLPIIKKNWLTEETCSGLIAISNFPEGDIAIALRNGRLDLADVLYEYWSGIFPGRFYLEICQTSNTNEQDLLPDLISFASKNNSPLVATNKVCFLDREDYEAHEARVCIHESSSISDSKKKNDYTEEQYFKTKDEMWHIFKNIPEAITNAFNIAKRCNFSLNLGQVFLPDFPVPVGDTVESYLIRSANEGLLKRLEILEQLQTIDRAEYQNRLEIELKVINNMGFAGYFLIVADFIKWAKDSGIPVGPGRGSGAGSLVAYALSITDIDPLQYDLLFERFLNEERVSMPDFDIDFCMEGRDKVIEYVANKYGTSSVAQIITFGTLAAKAVIRDVGRVMGHPYGFVDKIAKLIPMELGITLKKALVKEELLKERYEKEEEVKLLLDLAIKLEGITRNVGKHAGGVVIAPTKLTDFVPLYQVDGESGVVTQFDKNDVESIGLVKFDFLGLRTLTIIDWAVQTENQQKKLLSEAEININAIPLNCKQTFDLLCACNTSAIFQLESRGMQDLIRRLQPDTFEDILALVALFRPGPLQSGMVDDFINRKRGRAEIKYIHPKLESILKPTYGIIVYQEQVMQIAQVLAGYTLGAADLLRRAMGKKNPEAMAKQRESFVQGALNNGVEDATATYIFDLMEKFAGYGFNKSHSAAYAMVTYQTAWLKTHATAAFMAAALSSDMAHTDKIVNLIEDCRRNKITISPPDINAGQYRFSVIDRDRILYGLGAIKGVGESAIESIVSARNTGKFLDIFDLCARICLKKVSKRTLEALIKSGALDNLNDHRASLMAQLPSAFQAAQQWRDNVADGQADLFGNTLAASDVSPAATRVNEWVSSVMLNNEKETLGLYLSGHPIDSFAAELKQMVSSKFNNLKASKKPVWVAGFVANIRTLQTRRGQKMAIVTLDDKTGRQEIAIFSELFREVREKINKDVLLVVEGNVSNDDYSGGLRLSANKLLLFEEARVQFAKKVKLVVTKSKTKADFVTTLKQKLSSNDGSCAVEIEYFTESAKALLCTDIKIAPAKDVIAELTSIAGVDSVSVAY